MSHDIQALHSRIDNLKSEGMRLQEQYPGARAKGVSDQLVSAATANLFIVYIHCVLEFGSDICAYKSKSCYNYNYFQALLETLWEKLQHNLSLRTEALNLASEMFIFLSSANELIQWGTNMRKLFVSDELGRYVYSRIKNNCQKI